ncbi:MAG: glycosyltransferase family 2 protein, partial [Gemmatimonadota bacterium]
VAAALAADPRAAAAASLVLEAADPPVVNSVGVRFFGDLHAQNVGSGEAYDPERVAGAREAAFGSYGAVMCFRREAVAGLWFDEDYFLFFEETDFFLRLALLGGRTVFAEGALARHQRSLSTGRYSPLKLYYGERNRLTTVFKLLPVWYWPVSAIHTLRRLLVLARGPERARGRPGHRDAADSAAGAVQPKGAGDAGDEPPVLPSTRVIVRTLLRAWGAALARLPGTLRKRRAFWRGAPATPGDALELVRSYALPSSELRLR